MFSRVQMDIFAQIKAKRQIFIYRYWVVSEKRVGNELNINQIYIEIIQLRMSTIDAQKKETASISTPAKNLQQLAYCCA